jgi:RNA polymerase sigma factor (sigma-70 family)
MSAIRKGLAIRSLGRLFGRGTLPSGDAALLDCFISERDESAFEAIVARHGSMVLGVCRRLLGDAAAADDAFQATFLVLLKKARTLRDGDRLGPWLYGVATRVATKARAKEARRLRHTRAATVNLSICRDDESDWLDFRPILDAELGKLSPKLRDVVVLCLLEGLTAEEAARRTSCPLGTVKSRLQRGREALRGRLVARGVSPSVALAVAAGTERSALASLVSPILSRKTARMAGFAPDRIPHAVVELTRGITTIMVHKSSILAAAVMGGVGLAALGVTAWQKSAANAAEPGAQEAGEARDAARTQTTNHFKQVMLAFQNYQSINGHFPPKAIFGGDGQPKLSWRVAILPFLDQDELFQKFNMNEPWDSPHNKLLIARMPDVFATPVSPVPPGMTRIRVFEGPGTLFDGSRGTKIQEITDGTSNTVGIVMARQAVPWTKPGDLPYAPGTPLGLDDSDPRGVTVGLVDGSAHFLRRDNPEFWKKIISPAGGEVVSWDNAHPEDNRQVHAVAAAPTPAGPAGRMTQVLPTPALAPPTQVTINTAPTAPISPELEARLRAIEATLDQLLRRLDSR